MSNRFTDKHILHHKEMYCLFVLVLPLTVDRLSDYSIDADRLSDYSIDADRLSDYSIDR